MDLIKAGQQLAKIMEDPREWKPGCKVTFGIGYYGTNPMRHPIMPPDAFKHPREHFIIHSPGGDYELARKIACCLLYREFCHAYEMDKLGDSPCGGVIKPSASGFGFTLWRNLNNQSTCVRDVSKKPEKIDKKEQ